MRDVDVVVVGAGFAGLACATALAHRGFTVVVLERKRAAGQTMHTTGILVKEAAERLDLPANLVRRVSGIRLISPSLRVLELDAPDYFFLTTDTPALMRHFSEQTERAGVELRYGEGFRPETGDGDIPRSARAPVALPRHGLRCRWLIGSDGPRSAVARAFGLGRNRAFLAGVEVELQGLSLGEPDAFHCFLDANLAPGYIGWAIPGVGFTQVGLATRLPRRPDIDAFLRRVGQVFDVSGGRIVERRGGLIPTEPQLPSHRGNTRLLQPVDHLRFELRCVTRSPLPPRHRHLHDAMLGASDPRHTAHDDRPALHRVQVPPPPLPAVVARAHARTQRTPKPRSLVHLHVDPHLPLRECEIDPAHAPGGLQAQQPFEVRFHTSLLHPLSLDQPDALRRQQSPLGAGVTATHLKL